MALHIMDIIQNSIYANATNIVLRITENSLTQTTIVEILDNGKGMNPEFLKLVTDPYTTSRSTRKVGLGIPLFKYNAERTGGNFEIQSTVKVGTTVKSVFNNNHPDCIPLGDVAGVIMLLVGGNPNINFEYIHNFDDKFYEFKTTEIKEILNDVPINDAEILNFIKELIESNVKQIKNEQFY